MKPEDEKKNKKFQQRQPLHLNRPQHGGSMVTVHERITDNHQIETWLNAHAQGIWVVVDHERFQVKADLSL